MKSHQSLSFGIFALFTLFICVTACAPDIKPAQPTMIPTLTVEPTQMPTPKPTLDPALLPTAQPLTLVWQGEFSADAALAGGNDLTVNSQGNVYVTTSAAKNIKKFDNTGKLVDQWGVFGVAPGQLNLPTGIATDAQGNVYVADFSNNRIEKFDSTGKFLLAWPTDHVLSPASLGVDAQGNIYVNIFNAGVDCIQKFDSSGKLIKSWGSGGTGDGQFAGRTEDMTLDLHGNVYVADPFNHRIQKFDSDGNFLAQFGGRAGGRKGLGTFEDPRGIAVDSKGNVFIIDSYFLQKFDADGNFIAQWPTSGDLDRAGFIALDAQDNIYVLAHGDVVSASGDKFNLLVVKKFRQP